MCIIDIGMCIIIDIGMCITTTIPILLCITGIGMNKIGKERCISSDI